MIFGPAPWTYGFGAGGSSSGNRPDRSGLRPIPQIILCASPVAAGLRRHALAEVGEVNSPLRHAFFAVASLVVVYKGLAAHKRSAAISLARIGKGLYNRDERVTINSVFRCHGEQGSVCLDSGRPLCCPG